MKNNKTAVTNKKLISDKDDLFEKLQKITLLFGISVSVIEGIYGSTSYSDSRKNLIGIGFKKSSEDKKVSKSIIENVDKFHSSKHKQLYKECPSLIKYFLHEVGHAMTVRESDNKAYSWAVRSLEISSMFAKNKKKKDELDKKYREIPLEKVADALSSELLYYNYDAIMKILLGKRVRVTQKRIASNKAIAQQIRKKYMND